MSRTTSTRQRPAWRALVAAILLTGPVLAAQSTQRMDADYTSKVKEYLTDPRISTELVDHLPASDRVPTTLRFPGIMRIVGTPGELTHAADIHRYLKAIADAGTGRAKYWTIGKTEEGRDMVILAIADEQTIRNLDQYKGYLQELTDPRRTTEARAQELLKTAKPIYWITSGMHSTERGGPEMLMELAYRLVVEETPFIQQIRNNVITFITPVVEVDGRERMVDTYYYNRQNTGAGRGAGAGAGAAEAAGGAGAGGGGAGTLPLVYWGKYVAHDNNRDGMGQFLALTRNIEKAGLEWKPTILHDLHEAQTLLYASTGTGPYNEQLDAITINEWWMYAENDVLEMTKRGIPGVWTYNYYDGWVPNYMFYVVHAHNAMGRFYEVAGYGPENRTISQVQSREWFRPNPLTAPIQWGPRANTNIQESAILFALSFTGKDRERWLENYWIKNRNAVRRGTEGPTFGWVIPASQHSKANAADAVNELIDQGLEFHTATSAFRAGAVDVHPGDWIVRGDQPYRTVADIYFSVQNYPTTNPAPYDDTGWTYQMMRNIVITPITDRSLLTAAMTPVTGHVTASGGVSGTGPTIIVDHTGDNNMMPFRFRLASVNMAAAEAEFDAGGHHFGAGSFIIENANRAQVEPVLRELGLSGYALSAAPAGVRTHDLDVPRIGYIHSWSNTQNEGWVRAAFDYYRIPYAYFGENEVYKRNLRAQFDVLIWPTGGAVGTLPQGGTPIPYKRSAAFPSLGSPDSTDDTRGALGQEGLRALHDFVQQGGTLITEGGTASIFPQYRLTPGVTVDNSANSLVARGSIMRGLIADRTSPIAYGFDVNQLPVYFSQGPILDVGTARAAAPAASAGRGGSVYQNTSPMATKLVLSPWDPTTNWPPTSGPAVAGGAGAGGAGAGGGRGGGGGAEPATPMLDYMRPRVVLQFPPNAQDMLLSGVLSGGEALSNRPQLIDSPIGRGHVVMFAIRPFWRWQTQGTYILGFNTIMNWNDLDAGLVSRSVSPGTSGAPSPPSVR